MPIPFPSLHGLGQTSSPPCTLVLSSVHSGAQSFSLKVLNSVVCGPETISLIHSLFPLFSPPSPRARSPRSGEAEDIGLSESGLERC